MKLYWLGIIGMAAAVLGCLGDILLLYVPDGNYEKQDYLFFQQIPQWRLTAGHFLGVLFIPLELVGFWQVYKAIEKTGKRYTVPLVLATVYVMIMGVVYHGIVGSMGTFVHLAASDLVNPAVAESTMNTLKLYFEPFGFLLLILFVFISSMLSYLIWFKNEQTLYPKWMAFFNPVFTYLLIVILYLILPKNIGSALMVMGFNLSIFVLLAASTWHFKYRPILY